VTEQLRNREVPLLVLRTVDGDERVFPAAAENVERRGETLLAVPLSPVMSTGSS